MIRPQRPPEGIEGYDIECVASDAGHLWFPRSDGVMRPYIAKRGTWEPEEGALLRAFLRPGLRFLDVGANVGYFSLLVNAHCPTARIVACEPNPAAVRLLRLNVWQARAPITVFPVALTAGDRAAVLSSAASNLGDTRSQMRDLVGVVADCVAPGISADELLTEEAFDVVKIDVQGAEAEVVEGMRGIIKRSPGIRIVAEFWPTAIRERGEEPLDVLTRYKSLGLDVVPRVAWQLRRMPAEEIVTLCDQSGPNGQVNLLMTRVD